MRILFVSEFFPEDLDQDVFGVFQRQSMFIDALKTLGQLECLFYADRGVIDDIGDQDAYVDRLREHWDANLSAVLRPVLGGLSMTDLSAHVAAWLRATAAGNFSYFLRRVSARTSGSPQVAAFEERVDRGYAMVFAHRLGAMAPILLSRRRRLPVVLDLDDLDYRRIGQRLDSETGPVRRFHLRLAKEMLRRQTGRVTRAARLSFVCSELDRARLHSETGADRVLSVPNAVVVPDSKPDVASANLLHVGPYTYPPNAKSAEFLISEVLPRVRTAVPEAKLLIVGSHPEQIPSFRARPDGVEFVGFSDDLVSLYARSRVACCAVTLGSGTRFKILEAAAHGTAVVSTTFGAEGIDLEDRCSIRIGDSAAEFASACIELLTDEQRRRFQRAAAHDAVRRKYDRNVIIERIRQVIETVVLSQHPPVPANFGCQNAR
ncbi:MAG: glycosyltransferase family 4 protein [Proteobacteria bacterium]|nr:glycosyltransferase family 4 protein [Pseudomonadota bacterium]